MKRKKNMEPYQMIFRYEGQKYDCVDEMLKSKSSYYRTGVLYYSELMREALQLEIGDEDYLDCREHKNDKENNKENEYKERRKFLFSYLERMKKLKHTDIPVTRPVIPFVRFIDYLQGDIKKIDCDFQYMELLFFALEFGCLKLVDVDNRVLFILLKMLSNTQKYKALKTLHSLIMSDADISYAFDNSDKNQNSVHVDKYEKEKASLTPKTMRFLYDRSKDIFLTCHNGLMSINSYSESNGLYYSELMREILESNPDSQEHMTSRTELFFFLEKNKNSDVPIPFYAPVNNFCKFLKYMQCGNKTVEKDDMAYMDILFYASRYGCLKMFDVDPKRILKIFIELMKNNIMYNTMRNSLFTICCPPPENK